MGHVAAYLESNPHLLTRGTCGRARHADTAASQFADQMRKWLSACMDDPDFQQQLAAWYQS